MNWRQKMDFAFIGGLFAWLILFLLLLCIAGGV